MKVVSVSKIIFGSALVYGAGLACAGEGDFAEPVAPPVYEDSGGDGWDIQFRPYLWTADISGTAGVGGVEAPIDVEFSDLLDALDFTWSSTLEVHKVGGKWTFLLDTFYMKLGPDTPSLIDDIKVEQAIIDPMIAYRLREWNNGRSWLEVLGGVRWMYLNTEIEAIRGPRLENSESWWDLHFGLRMRHYFNERLYGVAGLDYGGFGINSDSVFQGAAGLGYHLRPNLTLDVLYRYFDIDYSDDGFVWDTETSGIFVGVGFYF